MRLAEIEGRIANLTELSRIVGAMRSIASMRVQEATSALSSVRDYAGQLADGVRDALALAEELPTLPARSARPVRLGPHEERRVLVLYMSEHGFVGGFNERLMEAAESDLDASDTLLILGGRGAAHAEERGHHGAWSAPMATRLASIPESVRRLQAKLYPLIASGEIKRVDVIFGRYRRGVVADIERLRLFPLEFLDEQASDRSVVAPLHDIPAAQLLERLTAEYLVAQLTEAATESLAAENGARFAAMEAASDNVSRKLEGLRLESSRARQEEVTTELLDLVTGEQALRSSPW